MTKAVGLFVARNTLTWLEALYENGVVAVNSQGQITVNGDVRDLIKEIHEKLSGGDPARFEQLEDLFDEALEETNELATGGMGTVMSI